MPPWTVALVKSLTLEDHLFHEIYLKSPQMMVLIFDSISGAMEILLNPPYAMFEPVSTFYIKDIDHFNSAEQLSHFRTLEIIVRHSQTQLPCFKVN